MPSKPKYAPGGESPLADITDYWWKTKNSKCPPFRDKVIEAVLKMVEPVAITEVGTMRSLSKTSRYTDGWATLFWYSYAFHRKENDTCAIFIGEKDQSTCDQLIRILGAFASASQDSVGNNVVPSRSGGQAVDGIESICNMNAWVRQIYTTKVGKPPCLVYLDGDDSKFGMRDQLEWIDLENTSVLMDDFNTKGCEIYHENGIFIERGVQLKFDLSWTKNHDTWDTEHFMGFIPSDNLLLSLGVTNETRRSAAYHKQVDAAQKIIRKKLGVKVEGLKVNVEVLP